MAKTFDSNKEYIDWLAEIKGRIRSSQQYAALRVNRELLALYWFIGQTLSAKQTEWGDKFIDRLALDLKSEFPDMKGFSKTNLKYMRRWYVYYSQHSNIGQHAVDQLKLSEDLFIGQQKEKLYHHSISNKHIEEWKSEILEILIDDIRSNVNTLNSPQA